MSKKMESDKDLVKTMVAASLADYRSCRALQTSDIPDNEAALDRKLDDAAMDAASAGNTAAKFFGNVDRRNSWKRSEKRMNAITERYGFRIVDVPLFAHAFGNDPVSSFAK